MIDHESIGSLPLVSGLFLKQKLALAKSLGLSGPSHVHHDASGGCVLPWPELLSLSSSKTRVFQKGKALKKLLFPVAQLQINKPPSLIQLDCL